MRMFLVYINNKPIHFQATPRVIKRFGHMYGKDVREGFHIIMQNFYGEFD